LPGYLVLIFNPRNFLKNNGGIFIFGDGILPIVLVGFYETETDVNSAQVHFISLIFRLGLLKPG